MTTYWLDGLPAAPVHSARGMKYWLNGLPLTWLEDAMYTLNTLQKRLMTIVPKNAAGEPAAIDATPEWAQTNSEAANLNVSGDGMSAYIEGVAPGDTTVTVSATSQGNPLSESVDFSVTVAPAVTLGIEVGFAEAK